MAGKGHATIGLEIHVQLSTASKLFCQCPTRAEEPNTAVCPTCLGMPGSKPMLNKKAIDHAMMVALALNCRLNKEFFFSRKTYFYPDLAKNFQITQYEIPIGQGGFLEADGKKVRVRRVHLEEDPASLVHEAGVGSSPYTLVDYNRSGIPLVEIVTEPDLESPGQARRFLDALLTTMNYLGVYSHGESVLKADCNISIPGGERVEVKNVTGFRAVEDALEAEYARQVKAAASGEKVTQHTRGFDAGTKSTYLMRTKESEDDYGYIFDADLARVEASEEWVGKLKAKLPELAGDKAKRFEKQFGLKEYDAKVLASEKGISGIFEEAARIDVQTAVRLVSRELMGVLNYNSLRLQDTSIMAEGITGLVSLVKAGKVSDKNAKESLIKYALEGTLPKDYLEKNGLLIDQRSDSMGEAVKQAVAENPKAFAEFKQGNSRSLNFLIGTVMRKLKGKADARKVKDALEAME